jgi:hypothetical protein
MDPASAEPAARPPPAVVEENDIAKWLTTQLDRPRRQPAAPASLT